MPLWGAKDTAQDLPVRDCVVLAKRLGLLDSDRCCRDTTQLVLSSRRQLVLPGASWLECVEMVGLLKLMTLFCESDSENLVAFRWNKTPFVCQC